VVGGDEMMVYNYWLIQKGYAGKTDPSDGGDAFGSIGMFDFSNFKSRSKCVFRLAWIIPVFWAGAFFVMKNRVFLGVLGGSITSFFLLFVLFATIYFKRQGTDERLSLGRGFNVWRSISSKLASA
jgi:hypothetical protein